MSRYLAIHRSEYGGHYVLLGSGETPDEARLSCRLSGDIVVQSERVLFNGEWCFRLVRSATPSAYESRLSDLIQAGPQIHVAREVTP